MSTAINRHAPTIRTTCRGKYTPGKRRFSIYWTWSYPWEANRDVAELDNRFSTMTEVRRVAWPAYETPEWSADELPAGNRRHAGAVPPLHVRFQQIVGEATGSSRRRVPAHRPGGIQASDRRDGFWRTRTR